MHTSHENSPESSKIIAPWTSEQVKALNCFQDSAIWHPYTSSSGRQLIATVNGWVEESGGAVVQNWAHSFSANGSLIDALKARRFVGVNLSAMPAADVTELTEIGEADLRSAWKTTPDGWSEICCLLRRSHDVVFHRVVARSLPGDHCNVHMQFVNQDGAIVHDPKLATTISVELIYLPKYDPTGGARKGFVSFLATAENLHSLKELALLFGFTVNQGHDAKTALDAVKEEARSRGVILDSLHFDPTLSIVQQRVQRTS